MKDIFIEAGINHFGSLKEANLILKYFLRSKFKNLTFMLHTKDFYENQKNLGIDFKLKKNFYISAIKQCHQKKKKLGLAVCKKDTFDEISSLKFDFYKLLSAGINQKNLIKDLKKRKKPIYISTGLKVTDKDINICLKNFNSKKNISLLHSPMTYNIFELNLDRMNYLKKKFKINVGYGNHNNDKESLNIVSSYNPHCLFLYCKPKRKKGRVYPDDKHAFYFDEIEEISKKYTKYSKINKNYKKIKKINIFANEFKF